MNLELTYRLLKTFMRLNVIEHVDNRTLWNPQSGGDEGAAYEVIQVNGSFYECS